MPIEVVTSSRSLDLDDDVLLVDSGTSSVTLGLPSPHPVGKRYVVKHISGTNPVQTSVIGGLVDGLSSFSFTIPKQAAIFHGDGTNWFIL